MERFVEPRVPGVEPFFVALALEDGASSSFKRSTKFVYLRAVWPILLITVVMASAWSFCTVVSRMLQRDAKRS